MGNTKCTAASQHLPRGAENIQQRRSGVKLGGHRQHSIEEKEQKKKKDRHETTPKSFFFPPSRLHNQHLI